MDPFTNNADDHPNLPDNDFNLSHDGTLSNMLDQGLFHMDSTDFSNIPRQSIEQTNISTIKQQIMSHDSLLRELEKLRQCKHDLEQENEKYKDEVVELRQKVAQNNSASSLNKLQEQINHYKALNEQLMQRVHNAEKELDNKNSQEPDKKSVKALKRDLQMKEEELATNRRLLEDSYNTLKKYKERLQNNANAKNMAPSSSVGISSSKSSQSMVTEEKLEEGSWKERVMELQDRVISLQGQLSEQNSMRHRLELELGEMRTENRMLKEGRGGDFQKEERGGFLFEEKMKETIAREGKEILEGLLKNFMKGNGENLMQVSSSPEKEKVRKEKKKKNDGEKEEKKKKKNQEKKEDVKKVEEENRLLLDSPFEKIEKKIKGENEGIFEVEKEKRENMIQEFNNNEDDDDIFGDFLDSVEAGGVEETNNQEFGVLEETVQKEKEVQSLAVEERKENDEIEIEEKEQEHGKIEEEPITENYQPEKEVETTEMVSEEPIMKIEEPETFVKEQNQQEIIQQQGAQKLEQCKEDLEQLNQRIQTILTEKKKKSRSELVENSFELLLRLYLSRFEAPKYFAQEDMKYYNQRHELIEILIQALDTEDLSDIAMKLIDIFVQLAKSYRLFSIAYAFWELVQDFSNFNSSKTVLDNLAGALYNFLFLPYISKKEREGFNTQLQDLNCTEKRHYLCFLKDILNIPINSDEESFSGLEKLNIFEGNPLKAMLLVVVLSIYQVCNKPLLVLEIVIDLISYQFSDAKSRCNLLFVALSICWKFLKVNLSQNNSKFILNRSTLHYLFSLKFFPLSEDHPNIFNLDFVFTALKMSVLIAFDKLPQEDSTQTLKLEILINKFIEKIDHIPVSKLDSDFESWLPTIYHTERFKNLDFQTTIALQNIYIDPSKSTVSCFYNFIMTSLESLLEAEKYPLSNNDEPSDLSLEMKFNVLDIIVGLHIISSIFAQTEWCDLAVSKGLIKYIEKGKGSLQKVLAIIGTGLFLPNIGNEEIAESIKEKLISIVTSKGEGEDNMFDIVASFAVLANYNNEALRENLEEVRLDERVVGYLDKDALEIYYK